MNRLPLDLGKGDVIRIHRRDYRVVGLHQREDRAIVHAHDVTRPGRVETFTHRLDDPFEVVE